MQDAARSSGIVASVPVLLDAYLASLAALKAREASAITGRTAAATLRRDRRGDVVAAARKFSMFLELTNSYPGSFPITDCQSKLESLDINPILTLY
jgi:hypothetical protein